MKQAVKSFLDNVGLEKPLKKVFSSVDLYTTKQDYQCHVIALHDYKALYFAVPKVANSSLRRFFGDLIGADLRASLTGSFASPLAIKKSRVRRDYDNYWKFGFVRNPWDRLVSFYSDKIANNPKKELYFPDDLVQKGVVSGDISFETFIHLIVDIPDTEIERHCMSQHVFLTDEFTGECLVDFVGKFEKLYEDLPHVCKTLGISHTEVPCVNKSARRQSYRDYYTTELKELVRQRYAKDIEMFEYEF